MRSDEFDECDAPAEIDHHLPSSAATLISDILVLLEESIRCTVTVIQISDGAITPDVMHMILRGAVQL
jgi:hypothetical protein